MPKPPETKSSLIDKIKQTGFILEHQVASLLEEKGWSVIHNRYYLDDVIVQQREIDIIAYKTLLTNNFRLCTALIISCKKSELYDWVFLTRKAPAMNYNINLFPISFTSNVDAFKFENKLTDWAVDAKEGKTPISRLIKKLYQYDEAVFAFKEFKDSNDKGRSDAAIFDSISSLIKAQSFETRSLDKRRKVDEEYIYNFNLLSVSDVNFIKLFFDKDKITDKSIDRINYINRFLINGNEEHSRIDFITFKSINKAISDYDILHKLNIDYWKRLQKKFYDNIWSLERTNFILDKHGKDFLFELKFSVGGQTVKVHDSDFTYLEFIKHDDYLLIDCAVTTDIEKYLNNRKYVQSFCRNWLKKFFRYEGVFTFGSELPF